MEVKLTYNAFVELQYMDWLMYRIADMLCSTGKQGLGGMMLNMRDRLMGGSEVEDEKDDHLIPLVLALALEGEAQGNYSGSVLACLCRELIAAFQRYVDGPPGPDDYVEALTGGAVSASEQLAALVTAFEGESCGLVHAGIFNLSLISRWFFEQRFDAEAMAPAIRLHFLAEAIPGIGESLLSVSALGTDAGRAN